MTFNAPKYCFEQFLLNCWCWTRKSPVHFTFTNMPCPTHSPAYSFITSTSSSIKCGLRLGLALWNSFNPTKGPSTVRDTSSLPQFLHRLMGGASVGAAAPHALALPPPKRNLWSSVVPLSRQSVLHSPNNHVAIEWCDSCINRITVNDVEAFFIMDWQWRYGNSVYSFIRHCN